MANEISSPTQKAPATAPMSVAPASPTAARATPGQPLELLERVRSQPKLAMVFGAALAAAALVAAMLWGSAPDYKVLYSNVSDRDGGAIIASLQQMNVPYKFSEGGSAILVPGDKVSEARLKLAGQGLPKSGAVGFELLDNQKFGTSQFAEQVNYQRGLEGELARSIESIGSVQTARVHLALPKASLFVRDQKKPSASVVLTLHRGRSVDEGQVSAIVHMVSSSVPDLEAKGVTVVDQRGNLLSAANAATRGLDVTQLKYMENVEQGYVRRIEAILQPVMGAGNVRAQVAAEVDFSVVENTDEKFRPNQEPGTTAVRSQQTSESSQQGSAFVGGVPGALSNQPPPNATAPLPSVGASGKAPMAAVASAPKPAGNGRRDVTTNYEVDRSIRHTQQSGGAVKRLSVAVVVNHREVRAANGKTSMVALTAAELDQVTNLVKEAMGFNQARGDSLNVVNSPFLAEAPVAQPEVPLWKDREVIDLAKTGAQYLFAALALMVAAVALLRMQRSAKNRAPAPAARKTSSAPQLEGGAPMSIPAPPETLALERDLARRAADIEYAQQTATRDPRLVVSLIRHWMTA